MTDLTIGAVMEVLEGEYYGAILAGSERVPASEKSGSWCSGGHRAMSPPRPGVLADNTQGVREPCPT
jgi:hypothetical protein